MEDIKRGLNEYSDVNRLTGQKAALRRSKNQRLSESVFLNQNNFKN